MLADADETALWTFSICDAAIDEAIETTDSTIPCDVGATASLSSLTFSATFLATTAAAVGMIFVLKSSDESPAEIFQRPVSLRRASSFAASSAMAIA
jgi:hypothetical protein